MQHNAAKQQDSAWHGSACRAVQLVCAASAAAEIHKKPPGTRKHKQPLTTCRSAQKVCLAVLRLRCCCPLLASSQPMLAPAAPAHPSMPVCIADHTARTASCGALTPRLSGKTGGCWPACRDSRWRYQALVLKCEADAALGHAEGAAPAVAVALAVAAGFEPHSCRRWCQGSSGADGCCCGCILGAVWAL